MTWARALVESMAEAGVTDAIVAPGSRSAPLALALDRSGVRSHVAIDERAGAYFAVGLARASRRPVAVVTTSGTAAANLHPAALEAFHGRVPLILLTADRPPELRGTGAPQTIDQIALFGTGVRWFADAGTPEPGDAGARHAASLGARAVAAAWGPPAGPVHLNLPFREPLLPEPEAMASMPAATAAGTIAPRRESAPSAGPDRPEAPAAAAAPAASIRRVARALRARRQGLIVCGPLDGGAEVAAAVARLAAVTGYPILADPLSGVRFGGHDRSNVFGLYDLFLRSPAFAERATVDAILQFGAPLTSKSYHLHAARHPAAYRALVDEAAEPRDPSRLTREIVKGDPAATAAALADALEKGTEPLPEWLDSFRRAERAAAESVARHLASSAALGEEGVFPALLDAMPDGSDGRPGGILYVGNSMPIRDLDLTAVPSGKAIRVLGNRGVNGIDGVLSSALGASAAGDAPLLAVVGDLSFHHDLNGLAALREGRARATIVVIQNDGGGIFSFLPVARHGDVFERYFGTPHGLDPAKAAALYGLPHHRCATAEELRDRAKTSLASRESVVLEVRTDRGENRAAHHVLSEAVRRAVEGTA
ncbi:MAG TPA: 2-succinyl-5-enolpyruvyl-6-hydroxy-3-cyclohexene-1-carboxylic-acid synthase [Candidatus Eisenbacteria bacterium]|nr:2-succinyl-5-enolpyruvyl-6-hydroxy-3-cyclohexene-1-carboxylic-acid synthase [Candidatus Eisenbacteria bacterium]